MKTKPSAMENVTSLNRGSIYELIDTYLGRDEFAETTKRAYKRDIEMFFMYLRNKDLKSLTRDDLKITYAEMEKYKKDLKRHYSSGLSVNRKIAAVRSLYNWLSLSLGDFINNEGIDLCKSVSVGYLDDKAKSYGFISQDEYLNILDAIGKQYKATEKKLFLEVAFYTSYRMNALRGLTWNCFVYDPKSGGYYVETKDKGDKDTENGIPGELYDRLYAELYNEHDPLGKDATVFGLQPHTINKAVKTACEDVGINHKARNIVFHSFRKLGVDMTFEITGDIKAASAQASHSDINTTSRYYTKKKSLGDMPLIRAGSPIDMSVFEAMSKEELLALIKNADYATKIKLIRSAQK